MYIYIYCVYRYYMVGEIFFTLSQMVQLRHGRTHAHSQKMLQGHTHREGRQDSPEVSPCTPDSIHPCPWTWLWTSSRFFFKACKASYFSNVEMGWACGATKVKRFWRTEKVCSEGQRRPSSHRCRINMLVARSFGWLVKACHKGSVKYLGNDW